MAELMDTQEILAMLKIGRGTLYKWKKAGMPYSQIGHVVRYDPVKVKAWVESHGTPNKEAAQ